MNEYVVSESEIYNANGEVCVYAPRQQCFLPPPSTPPRHLLRFGDRLDNRIGAIRVAARAPLVRPTVFLLRMGCWHPRVIVQTRREVESSQERQSPKFAVGVVLRVSVSELDRCSAATVSQVPDRFGPWPRNPDQARVIVFNLHIPRDGVFAGNNRNSSADTLLDCQIQAARNVFDGPALAQWRKFPLLIALPVILKANYRLAINLVEIHRRS